MQLTGNEILLAQFSKAGYIRMDDLLTYLSTELGGGGGGSSNLPSGIEFTLDTNTYPNDKFWIRPTVLPENYVVQHSTAVILDAHGRISMDYTSPLGVIQIENVNTGETVIFNILFIVDGFSKIVFTRVTNTDGVYSVLISENPFVEM